MKKSILFGFLFLLLSFFNLYSSIIIDGSLSDSAWTNAKHIAGFKTYDPISGEAPPESTDVYYTFDNSAIYFAFVCHEKSPVNPKATNIDNAYREEKVSVYLDTYNDKNKAYVFTFYPTGENDQALYTDAAMGDWDDHWNTIVYSATKLTYNGWVCETKIPFNSLKFQKKNIQDWNILFFRNYKDVSTVYPPVKKQNKLLKGGMIVKGIKINKRFYNLKLVPYGMGTYEKKYTDSLNYTFNKGGRAGADIWFNPTNNLTCNITINPDFSQIEADAVQFTTNQRFMLYYPETRPFFMEGSTYFSDPLFLFYTRRIQNPMYGIKIVGNELNTDIGFLHNGDRDTDGNLTGYYNMLSLNKNLNRNLSLGLMAGDKEYKAPSLNDSIFVQGLYNRLGALNLDYKKGIFSAYAEGGMDFACVNNDTLKDYTRGYTFHGYIKRFDGKLFNALTLTLISPSYTNDLGYFQQNDYRNIDFTTAYLQNKNSKHLQYIQYMLFSNMVTKFNGTFDHFNVTPKVFIKMENIAFASAGTYRRERYLDSLYNYLSTTNLIVYNPGSYFNVFLVYKYGNDVNYTENYLGISHIFNGSVTYSPIEKLYIKLNGGLNRFYNPATDSLAWNIWFIDASLKYKFTHDFSSRLDSRINMETKEGFISELLTYEFNSMSAAYLGITQNFENDNKFVFKDFVLFGKISYLFNF